MCKGKRDKEECRSEVKERASDLYCYSVHFYTLYLHI